MRFHPKNWDTVVPFSLQKRSCVAIVTGSAIVSICVGDGFLELNLGAALQVILNVSSRYLQRLPAVLWIVIGKQICCHITRATTTTVTAKTTNI